MFALIIDEASLVNLRAARPVPLMRHAGMRYRLLADP